MTKEEYEKLLQSDYWKGYSYSLIKERNFTCENCGRSFPNMRNMLQVHHLVYRDVNPWSYKPEELIVLCKECHQKRHGIHPDAEAIPEEETINEKIDAQPYANTYTEELSKRYAYDNTPRKKRNWLKFAVLAYAIIFLLYLVLKDDSKEQDIVPVETSISNDAVKKQIEITPPIKAKKKSVTKKQETKKINSNTEMEKPLVEQKQNITIESLMQDGLNISQEETIDSKSSEKHKSTIKFSKDKGRTNIEKKRSNRNSVNPKETTSDIWEKVNRKSF